MRVHGSRLLQVAGRGGLMLLFNFILGEILFPLCLGDKIEPQQVYWVVCSLKKLTFLFSKTRLDSHLLHLRALNTGKTGLSMHGHYCLGDEHLSTCLTHIS